MDRYIEAYIRVNVHVDAGHRVFCLNVELPPHVIGNERKYVLPISKQTFTINDFKLAGARVDVVTLKSLAMAGAEGRWRENIEERRQSGLPMNVYVANARSIAYAIDKGRTPPSATFIGRKRDQMTDVYDTVDEAVNAMAEGLWRTEFARGGRAKRRTR